jgi:hypothetical protein
MPNLADATRLLQLMRPIGKTIPVIGTTLEGCTETVIEICRSVEVRTRWFTRQLRIDSALDLALTLHNSSPRQTNLKQTSSPATP